MSYELGIEEVISLTIIDSIMTTMTQRAENISSNELTNCHQWETDVWCCVSTVHTLRVGPCDVQLRRLQQIKNVGPETQTFVSILFDNTTRYLNILDLWSC